MASFDFDAVKAEKEDALWRYNMEKKLKVGFRLAEFLLAFFLLTWYWFSTLIPSTLAVAGDFYRFFVSIFNKPLFTFVSVNFIIGVVYGLSRQKQTQKQPTSTDIYDEYVCSSRRSITTSTASSAAPATEETMVDKQIIFEENAAPLSPENQLEMTIDTDTIREINISLSPVKQLTTTMDPTVPEKAKPAVSSAELKENEYRRTGTMVSECGIQSQRPIQLGRLETTIGGGVLVSSGIEPPRKSMDEMSSEEFKLIIDSFIAERKKVLRQENIARNSGTGSTEPELDI
ncbi:hypothetical protein V6N13_012360 [Hibiscus sabdariffa]|uniref:Uncharacterized protein n=2 Tax=Hibiscus sabdariffa TaxID=183260 RepID=A0ABR2SEX1_9ROSI